MGRPRRLVFVSLDPEWKIPVLACRWLLALTADRCRLYNLHSSTGCLKAPQLGFIPPHCFSRINKASCLSTTRKLVQEVLVSKEIWVFHKYVESDYLVSAYVQQSLMEYVIPQISSRHHNLFSRPALVTLILLLLLRHWSESSAILDTGNI